MTGPEVCEEVRRRIRAVGVSASNHADAFFGLGSELYALAAYCSDPPTEDDLSQGDRESLATVRAAAVALAEALRAPADTLSVCLRQYGFWPLEQRDMTVEGFPRGG